MLPTQFTLYLIIAFLHLCQCDIIFNYKMNDTIPNEWSFVSSGTASIIPWTSGQSFCPYSMNYCWDGYCPFKTTNWTLTRNSQSTIGYTNVQLTFFISMKTENGNHNCYIEYMTDNLTWRIITHLNQNTYGKTDTFNISANNNSNVRIRLRSTSDNGTVHCYYNHIKLIGDPISNGVPINNFPTKYYTTLMPILNPTEYPLPEPTPNPTPNPTILSITNSPSNMPINPLHIRTEYPTPEPTPNPTPAPTINPLKYPTFLPTYKPIANPTNGINLSPTINPSFLPTPIPIKKKSKKMIPTMYPTIYPTIILAKKK
eukprot:452486_1